MRIAVKCFATLTQYQPSDGTLEIQEGATPLDVIRALAAPEDEVHIIFINNTHAQLDQKLAEGDRLGLFPAVGGG
jgi:molybdopterin converting factor small subunit